MLDLMGTGDQEMRYVGLLITVDHILWLRSGGSTVDELLRILGQPLTCPPLWVTERKFLILEIVAILKNEPLSCECNGMGLGTV